VKYDIKESEAAIALGIRIWKLAIRGFRYRETSTLAIETSKSQNMKRRGKVILGGGNWEVTFRDTGI
jgi:hypothetical protein